VQPPPVQLRSGHSGLGLDPTHPLVSLQAEQYWRYASATEVKTVKADNTSSTQTAHLLHETFADPTFMMPTS
jgi:hypothetical protein